MGHEHSIIDRDHHFQIDPIERKIIPEVPEKKRVVQYDHNSERFTFRVPRFVEGHDMSLADAVQIHYINTAYADREQVSADVYEAEDLGPAADDPETVCFSWLVGGNATRYAGSLNFIIRFLCHEGERLVYAWNTGIYSAISVTESYNNGGGIVEEYADVLEQWRQTLFDSWKESAQRAEAAAARAESAAASVPMEYTAFENKSMVFRGVLTAADDLFDMDTDRQNGLYHVASTDFPMNYPSDQRGFVQVIRRMATIKQMIVTDMLGRVYTSFRTTTKWTDWVEDLPLSRDMAGALEAIRSKTAGYAAAADFDALQDTTEPFVLVMNNNAYVEYTEDGKKKRSVWGDGGPCWFGVQPGAQEYGTVRSDGSVVYALPNQGTLGEPCGDRSRLTALLRDYVDNESLRSGDGHLFKRAMEAGADGKFGMDGGALISAVLGQIRWDDSRYALGAESGNRTGYFLGDNLLPHSHREDCLDNYLDCGELAEWFAQHRRLFLLDGTNVRSGAEKLRFGDILFTGDGTGSGYLGISQCALVLGTMPDSNRVVTVRVKAGEDSSPAVGIEASALGTKHICFARPAYGSGQTVGDGAMAESILTGRHRIAAEFLPCSYVRSDDGRFTYLPTYLNRLWATPELYPVVPGAVLEYDGKLRREADGEYYTCYVVFYDRDFRYVRTTSASGSTSIMLVSNGILYNRTVPENARYARFRFGMQAENGTVRFRDLADCGISMSTAASLAAWEDEE